MINLNLSVSPELAADEAALRREINSALPPQSKSYKDYRIIHRSIDARSRNVKIHLIIEVFGLEENIFEPSSFFQFCNARSDRQVVIAGAGPAGLFAALKLLEAGIKPLIVERGKRIRNRRRDIAALTRDHIVNPDSNYCFGEGGAGTFSDGKLYTRSKKRGDFLKILQLLVQHGAGDEILADARPHIGTNKLPEIIENIREVILKHGGEFFFETRVVDIIITGGAVSSVVVQSVTDGIQNELITGDFILATGHSARDIYEMLHRKSILMEPKPFAMGVRIEHPQSLIDGMQYHCNSLTEVEHQRRHLPAASYSLVEQVNGRGVYSFCMCPGGIIAPCATEAGQVVVNGWSPSRRNNPFANSGIVVAIELEDLKQFSSHGIFAGMAYQRSLEEMAYQAGGKCQSAPAQRMVDFVEGKNSSTLPASSYLPGIMSAPLHELLPAKISLPLRTGLKAFGAKMKGYLTNEAVIHGVETRTSSPLRIPRNPDSLTHPQVKGLFPVGEGAGYAGGIVSAAIDGQNAAAQIILKYGQ